jgi:hypothetical protein
MVIEAAGEAALRVAVRWWYLCHAAIGLRAVPNVRPPHYFAARAAQPASTRRTHR